MTTNAQAALQAAATVYGGGRGHTAPDHVKAMANQFKQWLDKHDQQAQAEPEVSHHISCATRRRNLQLGCDCVPKPYTTQAPPKVQPLNTLWTVLVRPRNSNADWQLIKVVAGSADQATSHILARYPGHAWAELTDTGEHPPVPNPSVYKPSIFPV